MKIKNIDASEKLMEKLVNCNVFQLIRDTFRQVENELDLKNGRDLPSSDERGQAILHTFSPIRFFDNYDSFHVIANMLHTIPIYVRDSRPKRTYDEDIVDEFGAYYQNRRGISPYIELYVTPMYDKVATDEEIAKWSFPETLTPIPPETSLDEKFTWLFVETLIHELAHATLDIANCAFRLIEPEKISYSTKFGRWREESMANAITLYVIDSSKNKLFFDFSRQHMLSQPTEYALGVIIEERLVYWEYRTFMENKEHGVPVAVQDGWLKYAEGNPDVEGLRHWDDILISDYIYEYKGEFYYEGDEVAKCIINDVTNEFEINNGRKMTYSEFKSLFPQKCSGKDSFYVKKNNYTKEQFYPTVISLEDTAVALYRYFDEQALDFIMAKSGKKFKVYNQH